MFNTHVTPCLAVSKLYLNCNFAALDRFHLQNETMCVSLCLLKACLLQTPGTFQSPAASSAINDLAYNISATIMKNRTEAASPPTY